MDPKQLLTPIVITTPPSRLSTPPPPPSSDPINSTPTPTFSISPAPRPSSSHQQFGDVSFDDENETENDRGEDAHNNHQTLLLSPANSPRRGSGGSSVEASSEPPSPSSSNAGGERWGTTLALRDNVDPEARRLDYETGRTTYPPPSSTGSATAYAQSTEADSIGKGAGLGGGKHQRRPSGVSFTSTIPDKIDESLEQSKELASDESTEDVPNEKASKKKWYQSKAKGPVIPVRAPSPTPSLMAPFSPSFTPGSLSKLTDPVTAAKQLQSFGGLDGLLDGLNVTVKGLNDNPDDFDHRRRIWGENAVREVARKPFWRFCWEAYQDKVLLVLSVAAVISLSLGLYQDLGTPPRTYASTTCANNLCVEPKIDWVEGVAITVAILIVVLIGSLNDYNKASQFSRLSRLSRVRSIKVWRAGSEALVDSREVVVGDICTVETGEVMGVDGVLVEGYGVRADESAATGESKELAKVPAGNGTGEEGEKKADSVLLSGSKILEGVGKYVVVAVGENSFHGKIMMSLRTESEVTPLQLKLNRLAELIAKIGATAGLVLFSSLMIRFFTELASDPGRSSEAKAQNFINILIIAVTVIVVAVPEGLPLAVTLALSFATRLMSKGNSKGEGKLLVRVLSACETSAGMTVLCTDKTGTLTQNRMTVVAGSIGVHLKFATKLSEHEDRSNANDDVSPLDGSAQMTPPSSPTTATMKRKGRLDFSTDLTTINDHLPTSLQRLLNDSIALNSTAFEGLDGVEKSTRVFIGSKTETALLSFAQSLGWESYEARRGECETVYMIPFSSDRKAMGVVVKEERGYRMFVKGASEVLAKVSERHVVVTENGADGQAGTEEFTSETRDNIARTIIFYANQSLRTIALCTRTFTHWPPIGITTDDEGNPDWTELARDLTLVAITAIEDPLRDGVVDAVKTCQGAGVAVKMCTGDNVLTARSIATQCGIYTAGGVIMEGYAFRNLTHAQRVEIVPRLQVLARSSPEDKKVLVECLKSLGEVVGVTGDGTNDGPALKTAHIGFSMGICGTEVAKEASDIILLDDSFGSIVSAVMWGRCVNDSVKKFLQFQISVNITAVVITFISAVASSEETSVLTAVQLLWVNLIMDTFAALALATDPADPASLLRKPDRKTDPLITVQCWMMIVAQAMFQITIALVLHFVGNRILGLNATETGAKIQEDNELSTLVFNTFVMCQVFNMFNSRRLDRGLNVFIGVFRNWYFLVIFAIMVGGQALIVQVGGAAFQVVPIGGRDWGISIVLGALSLPLGILVRLLPPGPFEKALIRLRLFPDPNSPLPVFRDDTQEQWNEGIEKVIDNLNTFSQIRGGRLRSSSIVRKSRSRQMKDLDIHPSALMAMVPSLIMGSIGAGWTPTPGTGTLADPASSDPSKSSVQLYAGRARVHADTDTLDPLAIQYNQRSPAHSRKPSTASAVSGHSRGSSLTPRGEMTLSPPSPSR